jgi:hypothetical protein
MVDVPSDVSDLGELDLDHVSAEIVQHRRCLRSLHECRQVEYADTVECSGHVRLRGLLERVTVVNDKVLP